MNADIFLVIHNQFPCHVTGFCIRLNDSFRGIKHFRNPIALIKIGPIMAMFQQT